MNILYMVLGFVLGLIFIGRGKNAKNKKYLPYEAKNKLNTKKTKEDYEDWCNKEALGCRLMGCGFVVFGIAATFMDSNATVNLILSVLSLVLFVCGFFLRIYNNKTKLGHYFTR